MEPKNANAAMRYLQEVAVFLLLMTVFALLYERAGRLERLHHGRPDHEGWCIGREDGDLTHWTCGTGTPPWATPPLHDGGN